MPKTLRPASTSSRPGTSQQRGTLPCAAVKEASQVTAGLTVEPSSSSSSSSAAATLSSQHPVSDPSDTDLPHCSTSFDPQSLVPLPPPLPPPPAPPLLPDLGKPATTAGTCVDHPGTGLDVVHTDSANSGSSQGKTVPLSPPGPPPVLPPAAGGALSLTSLRSRAGSDKSAAAGVDKPAIDAATVEAARLRLKKTTRTDNNNCKFVFCVCVVRFSFSRQCFDTVGWARRHTTCDYV